MLPYLRALLVFLAISALTVWGFYQGAILPLRERDEQFVQRKAQLEEQLDSARAKFVAIKQAELKVAAARGALNHFLGDETDESAMVAFPTEIEEYFKRFGLHNVVVRMAATKPEPDLPRYQRVYWSVGVQIPKKERNAEGLLLAVSDLEQQSRFIKVIDFSLQPDAENQNLGAATVNVMIVARKQ